MEIFKNITDTDAFCDMPLSAQTLYFHLATRADEQGRVSQKDLDKVPWVLLHRQGNSIYEMELLKEKGYITVIGSKVRVVQTEGQRLALKP